MVGIVGSSGGGGFDYVQDPSPQDPKEGEEWYDTGNDSAFVFDGSEWIEQTITEHAKLSGIGSSDHHSRYSDAEARDATAGRIDADSVDGYHAGDILVPSGASIGWGNNDLPPSGWKSDLSSSVSTSTVNSSVRDSQGISSTGNLVDGDSNTTATVSSGDWIEVEPAYGGQINALYVDGSTYGDNFEVETPGGSRIYLGSGTGYKTTENSHDYLRFRQSEGSTTYNRVMAAEAIPSRIIKT